MTEAKDAAPATEHVLGDDGQFHVTDAPIELSHYVIEDWVALGFFWLLGLCVFYQFFTRYALNDSAVVDRGDRALPPDLHGVHGHRVGDPPHASHPRRFPVPPDPGQGRAARCRR